MLAPRPQLALEGRTVGRTGVRCHYISRVSAKLAADMAATGKQERGRSLPRYIITITTVRSRKPPVSLGALSPRSALRMALAMAQRRARQPPTAGPDDTMKGTMASLRCERRERFLCCVRAVMCSAAECAWPRSFSGADYTLRVCGNMVLLQQTAAAVQATATAVATIKDQGSAGVSFFNNLRVPAALVAAAAIKDAFVLQNAPDDIRNSRAWTLLRNSYLVLMMVACMQRRPTPRLKTSGSLPLTLRCAPVEEQSPTRSAPYSSRRTR